MKSFVPLVLGVGLWSGAASAQIPEAYRSVAGSANVSPALFYAIALTESGQGSLTADVRPWPWTLSIDSQPHYYPTRQEAFTALSTEIRHQQSGEPRQLGIGLFQIEWRFHAHRFDQVADMLDPYLNAQVAAEILAETVAASDGDVWDAIGGFHSRTPALADAWRQRVVRRLVNLLGRADPGS